MNKFQKLIIQKLGGEVPLKEPEINKPNAQFDNLENLIDGFKQLPPDKQQELRQQYENNIKEYHNHEGFSNEVQRQTDKAKLELEVYDAFEQAKYEDAKNKGNLQKAQVAKDLAKNTEKYFQELEHTKNLEMKATSKALKHIKASTIYEMKIQAYEVAARHILDNASKYQLKEDEVKNTIDNIFTTYKERIKADLAEKPSIKIGKKKRTSGKNIQNEDGKEQQHKRQGHYYIEQDVGPAITNNYTGIHKTGNQKSGGNLFTKVKNYFR